jgi:TnpA family transposase
MASIDRTVYPRYSKKLKIKASDLNRFYSITKEELEFITNTARSIVSRLNLVIQFKTFQKLGYFIELDEVPEEIIRYIKLAMNYNYNQNYGYSSTTTTLYIHRQKIREFLNVKYWGWEIKEDGSKMHSGIKKAVKFAFETSSVMNNIPDIINAVIEYIIQSGYELPSFYRINRLVRHTRHAVNNKIFLDVEEKLKLLDSAKSLTGLLVNKTGMQDSCFNRLKEVPKRPTIKNFIKFLDHFEWLESFGNISFAFENISKNKLEQFAEEAKTMNISEINDLSEAKKYTFLASLIYKLQKDGRDALATMLCRLVAISHRQAISELKSRLDNSQRETTENAELLRYIAVSAKVKGSYCNFAKMIHAKLIKNGGCDKVIEQCNNILMVNSKEHRQFLSLKLHKKRYLLIRLIKALKLNSPTQDNDLTEAIEFLMKNRSRKSKTIDGDLSLKFASAFWKKRIKKQKNDDKRMNRRELETCIFEYAAKGLKSGDLFVENAGNYSDYRTELMTWDECKEVLNIYCKEVGIENNSEDFIKNLKNMLTEKGKYVDDNYFNIPDFVIDENEKVPVLKKYDAKPRNLHAEEIARKIKERMPERSLLDILCNSHYYTDWANLFGPISGVESKLKNQLETYILLPFCFGTGLGPTQTSRHVRINIDPKTLSRANKKHVTIKTLIEANARINNIINSFPIIKAWGDGLRGAGDGTFADIHDNNLIAEQHFRYRQKGGVAYHHVADNYIAIFSTFIQCGVWEAIYIIDGLLKNASEIQPKIIHSDTQGQSLPVFGLTHLLGIELMPRIRNWKEVNMYKASKNTTYENIENLFCEGEIDWEFLEKHWKDLMQIAISIKYGRVSSSFVLSKLSSYNYKNKLYKAFQELGKVLRTGFLLNYISDRELRQTITATTNKAESYNGFSDWIKFGSKYITRTNNPDEMEKAVKYNSLIANAIILQNVIDMSDIIRQLKKEGVKISKIDISYIAPYITEKIKRFGEYVLDLGLQPPGLADLLNNSIF